MISLFWTRDDNNLGQFMQTAKAKQYLSHAATLLRRMRERVDRLDGNLVEQDIAARRQEALIGYEFAKQVDRIEAALQSIKSNLDLDRWCKQTCECDISTMRRRKRLFRHWKEYEGKRRELGQCGQTGLLFALSLVKECHYDKATNRQVLPVRSLVGTKLGTFADPERCKFITGNALTELSKMPDQTVNVIVTSPPYWPAKRMYGGKGIGFEATLGEYITSLVTSFREARRVLKDTGVVWIVIDDSYARAGGKWTAEGDLLKRPGQQKSAKSTGMGYQDTKCLRPDANLLFIPARLAMALQDDGWMCRAEIIWYKGPGGGRPESVRNRVTKTHEKVFMFTKQRQYFYDPDLIREPLVRPYTPYTTPGKQKPGLMRRDVNRDFRVYLNPMGRNAGSVWTIRQSSYRGNHPATMPLELVRRCLLASCPEGGRVLDCFGGAGTTALAALQLGHTAISIDINPEYTEEARQRFATELRGRSYEPGALAAD
jgi:DNA modification methylase